jgi:hypothetical protein
LAHLTSDGSEVKILLDNGAQAGYWNTFANRSTLDQAISVYTKIAKQQLDKNSIPSTTSIEQLLDHHAVTTSDVVLMKFGGLRLIHPKAFRAVEDLLKKSDAAQYDQTSQSLNRPYLMPTLDLENKQLKIKDRFQITKDIFFKSLKQANK